MINISKRLKLIVFIVIIVFLTIVIVRLTQNNVPDSLNSHLVVNFIKRNKFIIPRESSDDHLFPKRNVLVNLTNFDYKINNELCDSFKENGLLGKCRRSITILIK